MSTQDNIFNFVVAAVKTINTSNSFFEDQKYDTNIGNAVFEFVDKSSDEKEYEPRTVISFTDSNSERTSRGTTAFENSVLKVAISREADTQKKETEGELRIFLNKARIDVLRCLEKNREALSDFGGCEMFDSEWELEIDDSGDVVAGTITIEVPIKYQVNKYTR